MNKINVKLLALIAIGAVTLISTGVIAMDNKPQIEKTMSKKTSTDHLTDLQKRVTMEGGTERAFDNEYWDNKAEGIYVDIINGEPLFSSTDKFNSGSGWPSFTCPISESMVDENKDTKFGMTRTEIKSSTSNAHLGHVFNDGPAEKGGLRYCINSASMKFVPKSDLKKEGYGEYLKLFDKK